MIVCSIEAVREEKFEAGGCLDLYKGLYKIYIFQRKSKVTLITFINVCK